MSENNNRRKEQVFDSISNYTAPVVGSGVGAAIGAFVAGPAGAIGGAIVGTALEEITKRIGEEIKDRVLSKAEARKIGSVYEIACKEITKKINHGHLIRTDYFCIETKENRSAAEEILEGVIFSAQREYEEKKIKYYGKLYANIVFDDSITKPMANQLIKISEKLTYRQLIILHAIGLNQRCTPKLPFRNTAFNKVSGYSNIAIASEIFELYKMSLLASPNVIFDCAGITPSVLTVVGYGALLYNMMELSTLECDDETITLLGDIMRFLTNNKE